MSALEDLREAIEQALDECPVGDVMGVITAVMVSIAVELVRRDGRDTNLPITIPGWPGRDITISAPKAQDGAQHER